MDALSQNDGHAQEVLSQICGKIEMYQNQLVDYTKIASQNLQHWYLPILQKYQQHPPSAPSDLTREKLDADIQNLTNNNIPQPLKYIAELDPQNCIPTNCPQNNGDEKQYHNDIKNFLRAQPDFLKQALIGGLTWNKIIPLYLTLEEQTKNVFLIYENIMKCLFSIDNLSIDSDDVRKIRKSTTKRCNELLDCVDLSKRYLKIYLDFFKPVYSFSRLIELGVKLAQPPQGKAKPQQPQGASKPPQPQNAQRRQTEDKSEKGKKSKCEIM